MASLHDSHLDAEEKQALRRYLLGLASEAEYQWIEERLFSDNDFLAHLDCLETELLDDYVNGTLNLDERRQLETHLQHTSQRQRKLRFARAIKKLPPQLEEPASTQADRPLKLSFWQAWPKLLPVWGWAGVTIILLIGVGFVSWQVLRRASAPAELTDGVAALHAAYRNTRALESRISGFSYARFPKTRGVTALTPKSTSEELDRAETLLRYAATTHPSPATYHALGQVYLAKREFDKAIEYFDRAAVEAPNNAALQTDLGIAWLEKALLKAAQNQAPPITSAEPGPPPGQMLMEFAHSLEHLNRALTLNPTLPEALFNRALCEQSILLPQQASQAEADWNSYLKLDASSPWAEEARTHLKELESQKKQSSNDPAQLRQEFLAAYQAHDGARAWEIARQCRARSGHLLAEQFIDSYLAPSQATRPAPDSESLRPLAYLGELELRQTGDRFISLQAQLYRSSTPSQRQLLAQGRQLLRSGQQHISGSRYEQASHDFQQAQGLFQQARAPGEAGFASLLLGRSLLRQTKLQPSAEVLAKLDSLCQQQVFHWLRAETLNALANLQVSQNEYSRSIQYSTQALELAERLQDTAATWDNLITLADEHRYLGDYANSLGYVERTLRYAQTSQPDNQAIRRLYTGIALNFVAQDYHASALTFQKEILELAKQRAIPLITNRALAQLSLTYGKLHQPEAAFQHAQLALAEGAHLGNSSVGKEMQAYAALHLGELYRQTQNPAQALRYYQQAIDGYSQLEYPFYSYAAQKGRLLTHLQQQNFGAAAQELDPLLDLFEKRRAQITGEQTRNSFFDSENDVYDIAVDLAYQQLKDPVRAFNYSESARARSLLDLLNARSEVVRQATQPDIHYSAVTQPLKLAELQARLPAGVQLLHYAVLKERLLIWVISPKHAESRAVPISLERLDQLAGDYLQQIAAASEASREPLNQRARELYQQLISPVETLLEPGATLCVIPDKILCYVPFNALLSPARNRYLLEDFPIMLSPSASVFIASTERARARELLTEESFLGIGNPRFNPQLFPELRPLPAAETEVRNLADCYRNAPMLFGLGATEREVARRLPQANVVHFATHAVSRARAPLLSTLVLAPEPGGGSHDTKDDGQLQACEIYQFKLPRTRLVVLSACQTGVDRVYRGEGAVGLARPFIAVEVPLVIASFWPVESNFTADFMNHFHHQRRGTAQLMRLTTAAALRQTQLAMLRNPDQKYQHPYYWAAFALIGGDARF